MIIFRDELTDIAAYCYGDAQLYRREDRMFWPIAPAGLSKPSELGRGLAGYVAQVHKEVRFLL